MRLKITRKNETLIEREVTVRISNPGGEKFCERCESFGAFFSIDEAAIIRQATARQIFRLAEADALHWLETDNGRLLICFSSLARLAEDSFFAAEQKKIN